MTNQQKATAEMLVKELGKVRCWLTGYHAGRGDAAMAGIAGEDGLRQAQLLLKDLSK